jgi:hypothetical protein
MREHDTQELLATWTKIQFADRAAIPLQDKLLITLQLMGRRFHYAHEHTKLLKLIAQWNKNLKPKINVTVIRAQLGKCVQAYVTYKEEENACYQGRKACDLTGNYAG